MSTVFVKHGVIKFSMQPIMSTEIYWLTAICFWTLGHLCNCSTGFRSEYQTMHGSEGLQECSETVIHFFKRPQRCFFFNSKPEVYILPLLDCLFCFPFRVGGPWGPGESQGQKFSHQTHQSCPSSHKGSHYLLIGDFLSADDAIPNISPSSTPNSVASSKSSPSLSLTICTSVHC